jgi:hypothetical protein
MSETFLSVCLDAYRREQEWKTKDTRLTFLGMFGVEPNRVENNNAFAGNFRLEYKREHSFVQSSDCFAVFWKCPCCGTEVECGTVFSQLQMGKMIMENPPICKNKKCKGK